MLHTAVRQEARPDTCKSNQPGDAYGCSIDHKGMAAWLLLHRWYRSSSSWNRYSVVQTHGHRGAYVCVVRDCGTTGVDERIAV